MYTIITNETRNTHILVRQGALVSLGEFIKSKVLTMRLILWLTDQMTCGILLIQLCRNLNGYSIKFKGATYDPIS